MADYFTNFSTVLSLPTKEAQQYALNLGAKASEGFQGENIAEDFPDSLKDMIEDWSFEVEAETASNGLWLHSSNGGIDAVCSFIQHLLQCFDPDGCASIEWSHDCSKPRTDGFGGGAAFITANDIQTITTGEWLQGLLQRHNQ